MASQWGRKETVIWPPHVPILTYGALRRLDFHMSLHLATPALFPGTAPEVLHRRIYPFRDWAAIQR